ncbi:hypothetical protein D9M70_587920 [compost metagenome]
MGQRLLYALAQQQPVGQAGERVAVDEELQLLLRALHVAEIGEQGDVMGQLPLLVVHRANVLPLRVHVAALAPVPDFAVPGTFALQRMPHGLVERGFLAPGLEHRWIAAEHLFRAVAGDAGE